MKIRFFERKEVWWPTWWCWILAFSIVCSPLIYWWFYGEVFLSTTKRFSADVLVVEGWIGAEGLRAAAAEFKRGDYQYVVATGGPPIARLGQQTTYAEMAGRELIRFGVLPSKVIMAPAKSSTRQRTFESAVAVRQTLYAKGINASALNVFTLGIHARRSRLVFLKVNKPAIKVGVIGWIPPEYAGEQWWHSSERTTVPRTRDSAVKLYARSLPNICEFSV